jgi:hypothetical protein
MSACCADCERPYGVEHGFPDLIIPLETWKKISPSGNEGGLLCPSCICGRLCAAGLSDVPGSFMSGPIRSQSSEVMNALRRIENLEISMGGIRP